MRMSGGAGLLKGAAQGQKRFFSVLCGVKLRKDNVVCLRCEASFIKGLPKVFFLTKRIHFKKMTFFIVLFALKIYVHSIA